MPNGKMLERTGKAPLRMMESHRIGKYSSGGQPEPLRWYEAELFLTPSKKYVCQIIGETRWKGEVNYAVAEVFENGPDLAVWLEGLTPWAWFPGFPPGTQFDEKRRRMESDLKSQFAKLITEILKDAPDSAIEIS